MSKIVRRDGNLHSIPAHGRELSRNTEPERTADREMRMANRRPSATLVQASPKGLSSLAVKALVEEAELTPKPALADDRGGGAQEDLSLSLMRRSAHCLAPFFELIALTSLEQIPTQTLCEELGTIGRWAEHSMLQCTGRISHRGAIWVFGLFVSAVAMGAASVEHLGSISMPIAFGHLPSRRC